MSLEVINRVWDKSQQHSSSLVVMQALAWYADKKGLCWPGNEELARRSKQKERNLQYILRELELGGEIFRLRLPGKGMKSFTVVTVGYGAGYLYRVLRQSLMLDQSHARQLVIEWARGIADHQKVQRIAPLPEDEKVQSSVQKVQSGGVKVQSSASKGAIQRRPYKEYEPSGTVMEPSGTPTGADAPSGALPARNMWAAFSRRYRDHYAVSYRRHDGDNAQLNRARAAYGGQMTDSAWDRACDNYFASPLSEHTMRDLCARFPTFLRSALTQYKTPVVDLQKNGGSNVRESVSTQRLDDTARRRAREDEEDRGHPDQVPTDRRLTGVH